MVFFFFSPPVTFKRRLIFQEEQGAVKKTLYLRCNRWDSNPNV